MKMMLMLVMCGILAGCDYTVPLVRESKTEIDKTLVGLWQRTNDKGQPEHLLILPLGTREYLVSFLSGTEAESSIFARACLCKVDTVNLVQIEWIGTAKGKVPDNDKVFQYAAYSINGDSLAVRLLNPETAGRDAKTSEDLEKSILHNKDNPKLFREAMSFHKTAR